MFEDIDYHLFALPGILISVSAIARITHAYGVGSGIPAALGLTGAEAAAMVMNEAGVRDVRIEQVAGELSDHYDARHKVLRLSGGVYAGRSLAAVGVAAHEAGHAIQDASGYPGLIVHNLIVQLASIGSMFFWLSIMGGLLLGIAELIVAGTFIFSLTVIFQLINLPVEFNASRRSRELLQSTRLVGADQDQAVAKVLNAAAWTYVAATLTSFLTLLCDLVPSGSLRRRRRGN